MSGEARPVGVVSVPGVLDWNPTDPDTVKVHYDVSAWSVDQRAELTEALAEEDIAHVWDTDENGADELVVPEELESITDDLFTRLEAALGPFPVALDPDEPSVEYGLDEWPPADRTTLTGAFVEGGVPHRWDGTTVFVPVGAEQVVDELLDSIEAGTLVLTGTAPAQGAPPEDALSTLFSSADRLAKDADDMVGRDEVSELVPQLDVAYPPYGVSKGTWSKIIEIGNRLVDLCGDDDASQSDIIGAAQELRSHVRQYV